MISHLISNTVKDLKPSGIRKFFDLAASMTGVISLGVGEPDFDTPWHITEEGVYRLEKGKTHYTSNAGLLELREEISKYYALKYNVTYNPQNQIVTTVGASEGIDLALRAIINPGDEILVVEPSFVSYKPCIIMAGGIPVIVTTTEENDFRLVAADLESKITLKTKALVLPYPNNPTGGIMTYEDLAEIVRLLENKDIIIISDEIYSELTYGYDHVSIASFPSMYEKTIVLNGFSKAYAMTGWRLGYALGSAEIIAQMTKIHQYIIMCAPTMSQYAGIEALKNGDEAVKMMKESYDGRRKLMLHGFRSMGLSCFEARGAFYLFPNIKSTGMSSEEFCERLLFEKKVAVVPGNAFGSCAEGYIRCSYAYSIDSIKRALELMHTFIAKYNSKP